MGTIVISVTGAVIVTLISAVVGLVVAYATMWSTSRSLRKEVLDELSAFKNDFKKMTDSVDSRLSKLELKVSEISIKVTEVSTQVKDMDDKFVTVKECREFHS